MNFMNLPERIPHTYATQDVDEIIPIYSGKITVISNAEEYSGEGTVSFVWAPSAGVQWELSDVDVGFNMLSMGPVKLLIPGYESEILGRVTSINTSSSEKARIAGFVENGEGRRTTAELTHVIFYLPNFVLFVGSFVRNADGTKASAVRAVLYDNGWKITLDGIWEGEARKSELDEHFILSHVGRLERIDGATFSPGEAKLFLDDLYWFFSFCRGRPTPAILPSGFDIQGNEVWCEWGAWNVVRFRSRHNWYNDFSAQGMEDIFPEFTKRISDKKWKQSARLSVYWYLEASNAGSDSAVILAQAAFELLAWAYLVEVEEKYSPDAFELVLPLDKLSQLLKRASIDANIPPTLENLGRTAAQQGWDDGPKALMGIRNALLHPSTKNIANYEVLTAMSLFESSQLTLWYLEMLLLWLFGYKGKYANRLILSGWRGQEVQPVPWAKNSE